MSYRNAVFDKKNKCMKLFTWDEEGNRVVNSVSYEPYLYVESPNGDTETIYGTKAEKRSFRTSYDRYKFVNESGIKRLYENINPVQQFLLDLYWRESDQPHQVKNDLKTVFLDIETYSPPSGGFPDVNDPTHKINVITCYDSLNKHYTTFGIGKYKNSKEDVTYIYCDSEVELFQQFLSYLEGDYPDILSGWNSDGFDIPYIINRGKRILDEETILRLSPINNIHSRTFRNNFGSEQERFYIDGVSCLDYLDLYKRFCPVLRQSYKLDHIGEIELDRKKIDYGDQSLADLADNDWQKFVDYNIQDVRLLVMLEEKLQYISLIRSLSYIGCTTFEAAMSTLSTITGAITIKARSRGVVMSTFVREHNSGKNPGAFVAEPKRGFKTNVVSFDANSLYPNIMISLNLSPETKVGRVEKDGDKYIIYHVSGKHFHLDKHQFAKFIKQEQCAYTKAGFLFSQSKLGVMPEFLIEQYEKRVQIKNELFKVKQKERDLKNKISKLEKEGKDVIKLKDDLRDISYERQRLDTQQLTKKINLNSVYGFTGNKYAAFGDDDIAASITLTGQAVIKQSATILQDFLKENKGIEDKNELNDSWAYGDTDSVYFTLQCLNDKVTLKDGELVSDEFYKLTDEIEDYLNNEINIWARKSLLTINPKFVFKREVIADSALFLQKKRYVMHILDDEGIKGSKFKYTGVEVVRTTMPDDIKPYAKNIIKTMLTTRDEIETSRVVNDAYDKFINLSPEELALVMGLNNFEKSEVKCDRFNIGKGVPVHAKAAYLHNTINKQLGIDSKYESIGSGDKVRFMYVNPRNKFNVGVIGFKYDYPKEYEDIFEIDYDKMFEKILYSSIQRFYESVNWKLRKPKDKVKTELFDIL